MPLHRVYETVDPKPEVFDIVIIDEASQCGPEALPLTFLSKRIIVVGDDHQISPEAIGIPQDKVHALMEEYLYDFSHADSFSPDTSLFDHGKRRFSNRIVLREHFRCMPEIIRFSNDLCYSATPLIPLRQYPPQRLEPLIMKHVPEGFKEGADSRAINRPEAEVLVDQIVQCCNDDKYEDKTMGVIVLQGNAQAALIEHLLLEQIGAEEIERRGLICGNPYSFQGDERDVIFMSMVAAPNARFGALTRTADQRRFNVAASRAKDQMWLFHSVTTNDVSSNCLRKLLLDHFQDPRSQVSKALGDEAEELTRVAYSANRQIERPPSPFDSWFEVDCVLNIASKGYRVVPQYPIAGKYIDAVIEGKQSRLAIEFDGDHWHGTEAYEKDRSRQRMLQRCGWRFVRIRECVFYANPEKALEELWSELTRRGIMPVGVQVTEKKAAIQESTEAEEPEEREELQLTSLPSSQGNELFNKKNDLRIATVEKIDCSNIQDALAMKSVNLRNLVIDALSKRPNNTCVKDALAGLVLKDISVISRGKPREEFGRKVNTALRYLERKGNIEQYKSKNQRVRLINSQLML